MDPVMPLQPSRRTLVMQPQAAAPRARVRSRRLTIAHPHKLALGGILLLALLLRLWGIKQGLPFSYESDEAQHFVPKAIGFYSGDWDPHYFLNPPAYSYLLAIVFELWFGSADAVIRSYTANPTDVFIVARAVVAILGTASVWLTYGAAARLFDRSVALLAAAISAVAFLPVFYSHLALNDVPALAGVSLALYGIAGVHQRGRGGDYLLAGLGIGLAAATKYTDGIIAVCLIVAAAHDGTRRPPAVVARRFLVAMLLALAAFTAANPYWILSWGEFKTGLTNQANLAAGAQQVKLGTPGGGGILYYLWSFTWGIGLGPTVAAAAGIVVLLVRKLYWTALLLVPVQIVFIIFMGGQQRYFGRWLIPMLPLDAILAAFVGMTLIRWLADTKRLPLAAGATVIALALLTQSVLADVHNDRVLSRPFTTNLARDWMVKNIPAGQNVVIEPITPGNWPTDIGATLPWTPTGERWSTYDTSWTRLSESGKELPKDHGHAVDLDQYERYLYPSLIQTYEHDGDCWVVIGTLQSGRPYVAPGSAPGAIAYYNALAKQGILRYSVSPYSAGADAVPFSYDWSIDYFPSQYRLPGPAISIYQLTGGRCAPVS
jgi:4-amino-4-deoxy-L-arabinose transferase-like glycosyltransferase